MSGFAVARNRHDREAARRLSSWARNYLRRAALADLRCAIVGLFVAARLRFGHSTVRWQFAASGTTGVLAATQSPWPAEITALGQVEGQSARVVDVR